MRRFTSCFTCVVSAIWFAAGAEAQGRGETPAIQPVTTQPASAPLADTQPPATQPSTPPAGHHEEPAPTTSPAGETPKGGFLFWPAPLALTDNISTDRPGFTNSPFVTPRGHTVIETGYTFTLDRQNGTRMSSHDLPELLIRTGLTDDVELRLNWTGVSFTETTFVDQDRAGRHYWHTEHADGATDMSVGFKAHLLKQSGALPSFAIIPSLSVPTGAAKTSSGDVVPEVDFPWNYALNDKWSIYGMAVVTMPNDARGHFFQARASAATCYQVTDKLSFFVEYFGLYPGARDADCQHNLDCGPILLINRNCQVDFRVGMGINGAAPDFFTGIGLSIRF